MANDRSIISWDTVLKVKEKYEIKTMLVNNYKSIYGEDINIDERTADAGWIDALTDILYDFSLLASNVYNSLDVNVAKGALLDNLVLLSGNIRRHTSTKTKIRCKILLGSGDLAYDRLTDIISGTDTENKKWIIYPVKEDDEVIYDGGVYPVGHPNAGSDQLVFLEHSYPGAYLLPNSANAIVEIRKNASFVTNTVTINDVIMISRGTDAETDSQLKSRKKDSLAYNSTSLVDSIRDAVLSTIFAIKDVKIYNSVGTTARTIPVWNGSSSTNVTIPIHDIFVLIKPEEGVSIIQGEATSKTLVETLQRKITLGISTYQTDIDVNYHTLTIPVNSQYNTFTETYRYYVAQPYKPYIKINYTAIPDSGFNLTKMKERVKNALYTYAKDYGINKNINKSEMASIIYNAGNLDVSNPTFRVDSIDVSKDSTITAGDNDVTVNNGYWFVDLIDELDETLNARISFNPAT